MKTLGRLLRAALDLCLRLGDALGMRGARWEWKKQVWRQSLEARVAAWENLERGVRARTRMCRECRTLVQRRERTCPACGASMSGIPSGGLGRLLSVVSPAFGTATTLLITVNVGMSLLILILWGTSGSAAGPMRFLSPPWQALYVFGEKARPVVFQGEPWRLITANYLHGGLLHLLFNCYALATLGPLIEQSFGARKFFVIYTVCGVFAFFSERAVQPGARRRRLRSLVRLDGIRDRLRTLPRRRRRPDRRRPIVALGDLQRVHVLHAGDRQRRAHRRPDRGLCPGARRATGRAENAHGRDRPAGALGRRAPRHGRFV